MAGLYEQVYYATCKNCKRKRKLNQRSRYWLVVANYDYYNWTCVKGEIHCDECSREFGVKRSDPMIGPNWRCKKEAKL